MPSSQTVAAISTRWLDPLLVGGALAAVFVAILAFPQTEALLAGATLAIALNVAINFPHFMASYRIVYESKASVRKYASATLVVPAILVAWGVAALALCAQDGLWVHLMVVLSGLYIGLHYTGQTWGMMAAFGGLGGVPFQPLERRLIRSGLYALALWHAAKFARFQSQMGSEYLVYASHAVTAATALVAAGFVAGLVGLARYRRRIGRLPPSEVWIAWTSLYLWYAVFASSDAAAFWVQIAHSLQYLMFPARLYVNSDVPARPARATWHRLVAWYVPLVVLGAVVFYGIPTVIDYFAPMWGLAPDHAIEIRRLAPLVISAIVNIHHFYTDGCIWKLRDPAVREALFRHLPKREKPSDPASTSGPAAHAAAG